MQKISPSQKTPILTPMLNRLATFFSIYSSLMGDKRTPMRTKVLPWAALLYLVFPVDVVPDFLPLLGQMDDVTIIVLFIWLAMKAVPSSLTKEYTKGKYKDAIDVTPKD